MVMMVRLLILSIGLYGFVLPVQRDQLFKRVPDVVTPSVSINQVISSAMLSASPTIINGQFEINRSGRYSVSSDIVANPTRNNKAVIYIAVSDVVLDLGGKSITLSCTSHNNGVTGVALAPGVNNVTIFNGTITGNASIGQASTVLAYGISAGGNNTNIALENICITECGSAGVMINAGCSNVRMKQIFIEGITSSVNTENKYGIALINSRDITIQEAVCNRVLLPATTTGLLYAAGLYCMGCSNVSVHDVSVSHNASCSTQGGSAYGLYVSNASGCVFDHVYAIGNSITAVKPFTAECAGILVDDASMNISFSDSVANVNSHALAETSFYTTSVITTTNNVMHSAVSTNTSHSGADYTSGLTGNELTHTTTCFSSVITTSGVYPTVSFNGPDLTYTSSWIDSIVTCTWIGTTIESSWLNTKTTTTQLDIITTATWIDTIITSTTLDTLVTFSTIITTMTHWGPDATITCSVYGFKLTDSTVNVALVRCQASSNTGGYSVAGFAGYSLQRSMLSDCIAVGNSTNVSNNYCTAYGYYSEYGIGNQWHGCSAQANNIGTQPFCQYTQQCAGFALKSEHYAQMVGLTSDSNLAGSTGTSYGIVLFDTCCKVVVQHSTLINNIGHRSYGFKDYAANATTVLMGNIAYGQGSVFLGNTSPVALLTDTGSMNYMLQYDQVGTNMQLLIKESSLWNMAALESATQNGLWYNVSLT